MLFVRGLVITISLVLGWQLVICLTHLPPFILPGPVRVLQTLSLQAPLIMHHTWPTLIEILLGLALGILVGCLTALSMMFFRPLRSWLMPVLIISQALPIFAIAPLLVIWFGYGITAKIITTVLMLFFPVANAFFDGLRRTNQGWLDLAHTMSTNHWRVLWKIQVPAALPNLASGIRLATAAAPMGAIIGEWVGSSSGLGFLMLNANARMQIDLMFAVLFVIIILGIALYFIVDSILQKLIFWQQGNL